MRREGPQRESSLDDSFQPGVQGVKPARPKDVYRKSVDRMKSERRQNRGTVKLDEL